ncbi:MAG: outer membrane protein assembly factor BamD [Nitrospiraceae bacterium]|nr:outer membrane protein assembly factor BamD [Nitrospiraceae bacterium]
MRKLIALSVLFLVLFLASCASKPVVKPTAEFDAEKSFARANKLLEDKEYAEARTTLLEIKNRDLTKKFAPLAQLRVADSYVKEEEPDLAVAEYRKFLEMYPDHRHAAYAQYQIAMVYFNQIEDPERGYGGAARALAEFEKLKKDFPRNPYRDLVDLRIEKCRNTIADYEYMVGEFYMKKGTYGAAVARFQSLLAAYPDYKKQEKVLLSLGLAYKKSGNRDKSAETLRLLVEKYPSSPLASEAKKVLASESPEKKPEKKSDKK